jgi:hypothetical protein
VDADEKRAVVDAMAQAVDAHMAFRSAQYAQLQQELGRLRERCGQTGHFFVRGDCVFCKARASGQSFPGGR